MHDLKNFRLWVILIPVLLCLGNSTVLADESFETKMAAAREALNKARFEQAAQFYAQAYEMDRTHAEAAAALYWEAFARYRLGRVRDLRVANERLRQVREAYPGAEIVAEAEDLTARVTALLAEKGEAGAAREIRELADDEAVREESRAAALQALIRMDPDKAVPILEKIITGQKTAGEDLKRHAVFMLCQMETERSQRFLLDALEQEIDPDLTVDILMCLSRSDQENTLDAIITLFQQTDNPDVKEAAMLAISRHDGARAFALLADLVRDGSADSEMRARALFAMRHSNRDQEFGQILAGLIDSESDPQLLEAALYSLSEIEGDLPGRIFLNLINNPKADVDLRAQALYLAGRENLLDAQALQAIYSSTDNDELKEQICHVATMLDDEQAGLDVLLHIARNEADPELRRFAIFWIGEYDDPRAADFLLEVINEQ